MLSELCRACGLCCDGSLFNHVKLDAGDAERLAALGVATAKGQLPQCCSALNGKDCRIYAARPGACGRFVCSLGEALERGDVAALRHTVVVEAHRLIAALAALLPPARSGIFGVLPRARAGQDGENLRRGAPGVAPGRSPPPAALPVTRDPPPSALIHAVAGGARFAVSDPQHGSHRTKRIGGYAGVGCAGHAGHREQRRRRHRDSDGGAKARPVPHGLAALMSALLHFLAPELPRRMRLYTYDHAAAGCDARSARGPRAQRPARAAHRPQRTARRAAHVSPVLQHLVGAADPSLHGELRPCTFPPT